MCVCVCITSTLLTIVLPGQCLSNAIEKIVVGNVYKERVFTCCLPVVFPHKCQTSD